MSEWKDDPNARANVNNHKVQRGESGFIQVGAMRCPRSIAEAVCLLESALRYHQV